ncbi:non-ribosomal peptide synthetase [Microvirga roseola]|uniref:non-ribosomal peptide synthetase n=1 Tax=Microvirga roseola TaxID=2883126 RepID=UPI001E29065A|nr:non-ribosomal peptide synthetase [Microvirga roseola]
MFETDVTSDRPPVDWATKLDGAPSILELPTDRSRPTKLTGEVLSVSRILNKQQTDDAQAFARSCGIALNAVLLALWQALLCRHTDQRDLVMGCAVLDPAGNDSPGWAILRSPADSSRSLRQMVANASRELVEGELARIMMPDLVAALGIEPGNSKHPVFQVALAECRQPLNEVAPLTDGRFAPCDLTLLWHESEAGIALRLDYAPQLFEPRRVERLLARFEVLLSGALADPDAPVDELTLLTEDEQDSLRNWNATARPREDRRTIAEMFAEQVARTPEAVAVEFQKETLTYRELDAKANRLAQELVRRGIGSDVTVGVSIERSIGMVVAVLAVLKAGGAYVAIDPAYPAARRDYMVAQSGARLLLTDREGSEDGTIERLMIDEALAGATDAPLAAPDSAATGDNLGYVIFTSGSTGQPKAVALPQRALTNLIEWQLARPDFTPGARTLQFASLSFDVSFQEIFSTWCSGSSLVLIPDTVRRDPRGLLDYIRTHAVNRIFLPFVALRGLADAAVATGQSPETLREVYTAGEQLVVDDTIRSFFSSLSDCLLENQYGPSESHVVTAYRLTGAPQTWPTLPPVGAPIANSTVHVLDAKGYPRPIGVPGELYLGGTCLAREYLGRLDLTAERFVERPHAAPGERLYKTGDLARWLEDGTLEFLGRIDHQVKFRGYRIELGEVSSVLSGFPGVKQCVASIVRLDGVGPRLAAYAVPRDGAILSLQDLHRFARSSLPDYMVPSHYLVLDSLPLTPSGKIDTARLPAPAFDRGILSTAYEEPAGEAERRLASIWQELLGISEIGRHDDFFDLGGDSMMAVEMFLLIAEQFGQELPLGALAQFPTIAGLAGLLENHMQENNWQVLVPLKTGGERTPLFCVHGGSGNIASFPKLARAMPPDQPVYGLQWDGLEGRGGARTIEAMAKRYLQDIRTVQPHGPYLLAGQCIGGIVAREIAHKLVDAGEEVALLVMYESPNMCSREFRLLEPLPAFPSLLSPLLLRSAGATIMGLKVLLGKYKREQILRIRSRDLSGRQVAQEDRNLHGSLVMVRAMWKYTIRLLPVRTLYFHNGSENGRPMALAGRWRDGMKGWSGHVSKDFEVHKVDAEHNDIPFAPAALALLAEELEQIHRSRSGQRPADEDDASAILNEPLAQAM